MTKIEQHEGFVRVTTDEPIWILLLKGENEYIDYVFLPVGFCDCGCDEVVWAYTEEAIMQHIIENNLIKHIPTYDTDRV